MMKKDVYVVLLYKYVLFITDMIWILDFMLD